LRSNPFKTAPAGAKIDRERGRKKADQPLEMTEMPNRHPFTNIQKTQQQRKTSRLRKTTGGLPPRLFFRVGGTLLRPGTF